MLLVALSCWPYYITNLIKEHWSFSNSGRHPGMKAMPYSLQPLPPKGLLSPVYPSPLVQSRAYDAWPASVAYRTAS
jgi:hypothetical protein